MLGIEKAPAHLRALIERTLDPDDRVVAAFEDDRAGSLAAVTVAYPDGCADILIFQDGDLVERESADSADPAGEARAWLNDIVEERLQHTCE